MSETRATSSEISLRQAAKFRGCRLDEVAGPHDQRQAERPDELAQVANAIAEAHAAGAQPGGPDLGHVWTDHRVVGATEEGLEQEEQVEHRPGADRGVVEIALRGHTETAAHHAQGRGTAAAQWLDQRGDEEAPQ